MKIDKIPKYKYLNEIKWLNRQLKKCIFNPCMSLREKFNLMQKRNCIREQIDVVKSKLAK